MHGFACTSLSAFLPGATLHRCSLGKRVLKICSKFTGEHLCQSAISKLQSNFIDVALRQGCSPVNLLHIFRTSFPSNTSGCLLLINGYVYSMYLYINIGVESADGHPTWPIFKRIYPILNTDSDI